MSTGKLKAQYNRVRTRYACLCIPFDPMQHCPLYQQPRMHSMQLCQSILPAAVYCSHPCSMYTRPCCLPLLLSPFHSTALHTTSIWENTIGLQQDQAGTNSAIEASIYAPGGAGRGRDARRQRAQELIESSKLCDHYSCWWSPSQCTCAAVHQ